MIPKIEDFLSTIIKYPSVTEKEFDVLCFLDSFLTECGFAVKRIPISDSRFNLYIEEGSPGVCFSTHVDVVPAHEKQFQPYIENDKLHGRGSTDAKGQLVAQLYAALKLKELGKKGFSLLFVVGEEEDGIGAKTAASFFPKHYFDYFINGEPTDLKLIKAHKGAVTFNIITKGKSAHSGYPEYGIDANYKMLEICSDLMKQDFGSDPVLGNATTNIGRIDAGSACNVVSDHAIAKCVIRTVSSNDEVIRKIKKITQDKAEIEIIGNGEKVELKTVEGFDLGIVSYFTDIPYYSEISKHFLLYGPGSILQAHTKDEYLELDQLHKAVEGNLKLFNSLN